MKLELTQAQYSTLAGKFYSFPLVGYDQSNCQKTKDIAKEFAMKRIDRYQNENGKTVKIVFEFETESDLTMFLMKVD